MVETCNLCGMGELVFHPPLRICAGCDCRIKNGGIYYSKRSSKSPGNECSSRKFFCNKCCIGGKKDGLEKCKSIETYEEFLRCCICNCWQHQICALFNPRKGKKSTREAEYTCKDCSLKHELPPNVNLGAKDLPTTMLSDHVEKWLLRRLNEERAQRASNLGKKTEEVPGAEDLVVRVVSSVNKKVEVTKLFREILKEENYPVAFPYKSKAILLFQKIGGQDVCLFCMLVQEYGTECPFPNRRRVCLSYLDSVKYFEPDIRSVSGEALRTFAYHEILIGYLDFCKRQGFTSCYIWICPPSKYDDYILYSHPESQKTPKPIQLQKWYQALIDKAVKERIVVSHSNLYDQFLSKSDESKASNNLGRLPYFDGDYWPGIADLFLQVGKNDKITTERSTMAYQNGISTTSSKEFSLIQHIRNAILPKKESYMVINLREICKRCCRHILSGRRWICTTHENFQLCDKCHGTEEIVQKKHSCQFNATEEHSFTEAMVDDIPCRINDKHDIQSDIFSTRVAFLGFCQDNRYYFDTIRRAKHSTMMMLYHLHNPERPACAASYFDDPMNIDTGQTKIVVLPDPDMEKRMRDVLLHSLRCGNQQCTYRFCAETTRLLRHGRECKIAIPGICKLCKKMWFLLILHARSCQSLICYVPKCKELKKLAAAADKGRTHTSCPNIGGHLLTAFSVSNIGKKRKNYVLSSNGCLLSVN